VAVAAMMVAGADGARADSLSNSVRADLPSLLYLYHDLHRHPELSGKETRTAALLAEQMGVLGFKVTTGVGGTGVVAVMENGSGPVILLRTDMDALPVSEATGVSYASVEPGVMHACGHDIHMASWIGAARRLSSMKGLWSGTLVMIAQPAEETGSGAKAMLEDGLFTRFPRPEAAIAFHDAADMPAGTIGYSPGNTFANVDSVDILVRGVGGHGAYPHNTRDPVVLAAKIVLALQTIVAREVDPQDAAVITVGRVEGGTKRNVIPSAVKLELTVRSYSPDTREKLLAAIERVARGEAIASGMPEDRMPIVSQAEGPVPATVNTEPLTARVISVFEQRFGDRVKRRPPTMAAEDFGRFRTGDKAGIQSLLFWVGGVSQEKWDAAGGDAAKLPSLHSPLWAPDPEPTIATATEAMTAAALELLKKR
jgi:hippurate hydrolase